MKGLNRWIDRNIGFVVRVGFEKRIVGPVLLLNIVVVFSSKSEAESMRDFNVLIYCILMGSRHYFVIVLEKKVVESFSCAFTPNSSL